MREGAKIRRSKMEQNLNEINAILKGYFMQSQQKEVFQIIPDAMLNCKKDTEFADWELAVYSDGEKIFLYGGMYGNEQLILLMANFDGVRTVWDKGHIYVPTDWLMNVFPARRERIKELDAVIRAKLPKKP
jgi:hypothetical protein